MNEVFLDTSYAIALSSPKDANHRKAVTLAQDLEKEGTQIVTTRGVVFEIGNALSRFKYRKAAIALLSAIDRDPKVELIPASEELCERAFDADCLRSASLGAASGGDPLATPRLCVRVKDRASTQAPPPPPPDDHTRSTGLTDWGAPDPGLRCAYPGLSDVTPSGSKTKLRRAD